MPSFFDKLKPQQKVVAPTVEPVAQIIAPQVETPKPVEVIAVPEPDFKNTLIGTPFETPIVYAKKYYEAAGLAGELTDEMKTKMAAFTEISNILSAGWSTEQETNAAAERSKLPSEKLRDKLNNAINTSSYYNNDSCRRNIDYGFQIIVGGAKTKFDQQKLVSDQPPEEIVKTMFENGDLVKNVDMGNLINGYAGLLDKPADTRAAFLRSEEVKAFKALGIIPNEAPDGGRFPRDNENGFLIKLLKKDGKGTETDGGVVNQRQVVDFKRPLDIDGVSAVISIPKDMLENSGRYFNSDGYPITSGFRLELSPEFYTKTLGVKPTESPVEKATE